jgi:hypothetical protein
MGQGTGMGSATAVQPTITGMNGSGITKELLRHVVVPEDRKRPQTSSPNGMHPMGLTCQSV